MQRIIGVALAVAVATASCKKDAPSSSLPEATHTGANTAKHLINGQPSVATEHGSGLRRTQPTQPHLL